jgi:hypothetical protein
MNMPGFTAEFATHSRAALFNTLAPDATRSTGGTVVMACAIGYEQTCESTCAEYTTNCFCTPIPTPPRCPSGEIMCPGTGKCSRNLRCQIQPF